MTPKEKKALYARKYYLANKSKWTQLPKELRRKRMREWLAKNPDYKKIYSSTYFRTKQLEQMAGRPKPATCEVCGEGNYKICYDHDHKTGKFRGWLCMHCNSTLGYAKDNPEVLQKLIDYLEFNKMFHQGQESPPITKTLSAGVAQPT